MSNRKRGLSVASQSDEREDSELSNKRRPTVYDAVAGQVKRDAIKQESRNTSKWYTGHALRPDEILYKARNAPTRYEETDHYFAHARLSPDQKLPSGDLLSAIHAYVSQFYARSQGVVNPKVWRCMDETALIAMGILIEESAREILGETGDLVFTEGIPVEEERPARETPTRERRPDESRQGSRASQHEDEQRNPSSEDDDSQSDDEFTDDDVSGADSD